MIVDPPAFGVGRGNERVLRLLWPDLFASLRTMAPRQLVLMSNDKAFRSRQDFGELVQAQLGDLFGSTASAPTSRLTISPRIRRSCRGGRGSRSLLRRTRGPRGNPSRYATRSLAWGSRPMTIVRSRSFGDGIGGVGRGFPRSNLARLAMLAWSALVSGCAITPQPIFGSALAPGQVGLGPVWASASVPARRASSAATEPFTKFAETGIRCWAFHRSTWAW